MSKGKYTEKTFEEQFGAPLGEQSQGPYFALDGINPNGLKTLVSRSGFTQNVGDGTKVTYKEEWMEPDEWWVVSDGENSFKLTWPGDVAKEVMFQFAWFQGQYCVRCADSLPR